MAERELSVFTLWDWHSSVSAFLAGAECPPPLAQASMVQWAPQCADSGLMCAAPMHKCLPVLPLLKILRTDVSYSVFDFALRVLRICDERVTAPLFKGGNVLGHGWLEQNHCMREKHLHRCHQVGEDFRKFGKCATGKHPWAPALKMIVVR